MIGTLTGVNQISTEQETAKVNGIQNRAKCSWLRLQHGRRVDGIIANHRDFYDEKLGDATSIVMDAMINEDLTAKFKQRPLQYIVVGGQVKGIASLKHLLIPPEQVLEAAKGIADAQGLELAQEEGLAGLVSTDREIAGIKIGFHIYPGDILTRRAISVSSYACTIMCTNPLTWSGIGNFGRFGLDKTHERILRIERITELKPRLESAIKGSRELLGRLTDLIEKSRNTRVKDKEAKTILTAFCSAYGIGLSPIEEAIKRLELEPKTTFGMAQAASWVARHGETWRKTPKDLEGHARQGMATVGAASLLIDDPKDIYTKALKWLDGKFPEYTRMVDIVGRA